MARCPLCSERSAKRFCPAKQVMICAVCCGTKREVEIDCPSSCVHLKAGRSYESERKPLDYSLVARARAFNESFLREYGSVVDALGQAVAEERLASPWLVDTDVIEVYKALRKTLKTLSSGIYYETLPEGAARQSLFRTLKSLLDEHMTSIAEARTRTLKTSEALDILDFLMVTAEANSSGRPRGRQYLDWLSEMAGVAEPQTEARRLILP